MTLNFLAIYNDLDVHISRAGSNKQVTKDKTINITG